MSGSAPTNNSAVDFEEQQAAQAQQQEAERQARLQAGTQMINKIFDFSAATPASSSQYDWSSFKAPTLGNDPTTGSATMLPASGVPAGYTAVQVPTKGAGAATSGGGATGGSYVANPNYGQFGQQNPSIYVPNTSGGGAGAGGAAAGGTTWALQDASGKIYYQGDPLTINTPAQAAGGFGPDFYNAYEQKVLDYYDPQEEKQYAEAKRDLTFNLARAGTLNSSAAADKTGDLAYNDALNKASIVANANQQTGQLQTQILGNKQSLLNQLYATEDPTETANLAASSAKASQLQDPTLTPAAAFFAPALSGVGGAANTLTSPYSTLTATGAPIVQPPAVASASAASDKTFS